MNRIIVIGNLIADGNWKLPQRGIIYSASGICGCLNGMDFRNNHPKVLVYE